MWTSRKSVILSVVFTRIVLCIILITALATPNLVNGYMTYSQKDATLIVPLMLSMYACYVPALLAMVCLDRLLCNIKQEQVFIRKNVFLLRVISWCCFGVAVILLVSAFYYILFVAVALSAAFFGMILRVVKNVIEQAVILKEENELTI